VGFVGREELRLEGRAGLESYYETLLVGEADQCLFVKDAHGRQLQLERVHRGRAGYDLELTLDARLQRAAEAELLTSLEISGANRGSVVVLEAHTGNLLALASAPLSARPSTGAAYDSDCWCLRPVQSAIEPGSTVKPFIAAAGLSAGVVGPGEVFDCTNRGIKVGNTWIRDHAKPDTYSLAEVIIMSSNAGIIQVAERLDEELLWRVFNGLGFGRKPDLGFPSEASGILWPVERWSSMSPSGLALGQELTTSPLQLALAYAAIANGGWLPEPRLVDRMRGRIDSARDRVQSRTRVMDRPLANRIASMLEQVVVEGTGTMAQVPGYRVAGKTGTAQMAVDGTFDDKHHAAWFAGFLPMPDPRWVIVVVIEDPTKTYWASSVAAPVFAKVAMATIHMAGLPPTVAPDAPEEVDA
jgi:cell division protein FtsI/penicillin-binding protein 2